MDTMKDEFLGLSDYAFGRLAGRLEGLSDEEYFWEPAPDCWNVRIKPDGSAEGDWGFVMDYVPPITTIAWRIAHLIDCLTAERCARVLRQGYVPLEERVPPDAASARRTLQRANEIWHTYVANTSDPVLQEHCGPEWGIYAEDSRASFVLHIVDELIHHAAEISLLRDLYRVAHTSDEDVSRLLRGEPVDTSALERTRAEHPDLVRRAAAEGRWKALEPLLDLGFAIEETDGRTALHHAAAANNVDAVRLLLDRGANAESRDPIYLATPLGWAEYFHRDEAADVLRTLTTA